MKLLTTLTLVLFTLTLKAQLVTCNPEIKLEGDTTTTTFGLHSTSYSGWSTVLSLKPNPGAKEGYVYDNWIPLSAKIQSPDFITIVLAGQYRSNQNAGTIEMQTYHCVYVIKGTNKK